MTHFLSDEEEVIHHVLGLAGKFLTQHRVLRGHAHRTGVEVAFAHHDAAFDHQRRGGKTEFIRAQQCANRYIATSFHLTVGLHANASAQAVQHQGLLGFGQTDFPGAASVFDGRPRRRACATVVSGDHHVIGFALGYSSRYRADTDFRHQLDADIGVRCDVFQIMNELRQVFDGINVVVRWR